MLDHVSIGVRDIAKAKSFYVAALKPLGLACLSADDNSLGYGKEAAGFWIYAAERPVPDDPKSGLHFCFAAPSRAGVTAFHAAALAKLRHAQIWGVRRIDSVCDCGWRAGAGL